MNSRIINAAEDVMMGACLEQTASHYNLSMEELEAVIAVLEAEGWQG